MIANNHSFCSDTQFLTLTINRYKNYDHPTLINSILLHQRDLRPFRDCLEGAGQQTRTGYSGLRGLDN